eukprot:6528041-Ditylum_brightwellii.AAC.1
MDEHEEPMPEEEGNDINMTEWLEKIDPVISPSFPFLDMQMSWKEDILTFSIISKLNYTIKYVSKKSCHRRVFFSAKTARVFMCLGWLISITKTNIGQLILNLYPNYMKTLETTGITPHYSHSMSPKYCQIGMLTIG